MYVSRVMIVIGPFCGDDSEIQLQVYVGPHMSESTLTPSIEATCGCRNVNDVETSSTSSLITEHLSRNRV